LAVRDPSRPTSDGTLSGAAAQMRLVKVMRNLGPVRLTGVSVIDLISNEAPKQLFFDEPYYDKQERLGETINSIVNKFGHSKIVRASMLKPKKK
jgi:hypothetical protein